MVNRKLAYVSMKKIVEYQLDSALRILAEIDMVTV